MERFGSVLNAKRNVAIGIQYVQLSWGMVYRICSVCAGGAVPVLHTGDHAALLGRSRRGAPLRRRARQPRRRARVRCPGGRGARAVRRHRRRDPAPRRARYARARTHVHPPPRPRTY